MWPCFTEVKSTSSCTCHLWILSPWFILCCMFYNVWPGATCELVAWCPVQSPQLVQYAQATGSQFHLMTWVKSLGSSFPTNPCHKLSMQFLIVLWLKSAGAVLSCWWGRRPEDAMPCFITCVEELLQKGQMQIKCKQLVWPCFLV